MRFPTSEQNSVELFQVDFTIRWCQYISRQEIERGEMPEGFQSDTKETNFQYHGALSQI